ncbi:MAG: iron-containing alcohol dehydrogenase [Chordicoccus sp.]|jgi:alcohol dehydrogenase YqhD (iron-dependent ADH family)
MLGNFSYCNPARLHFGEQAMDALAGELARYGRSVLMTYGGGSIKKNGIYQEVRKILEEQGKQVTELSGIMPNPTTDKLADGIAIARSVKPDLILAVGGGSVIDYSKTLSISANCEEDPWEKYLVRQEEPDCPIIPVGVVLTMVGTGSEMNGGAVITNPAKKLKLDYDFSDTKPEMIPRFVIMNPRFTMTLPKYQMVAGIYDIFCHICEQYFSGEDDNTSDYISEGLMRSVIHSGLVAVKNPNDYEARSNLMWSATWALNSLISKGKTTDWMVHKLGQAVSAVTNATHGMTLSAVSIPYYQFILSSGLPKFVRFAEHVWDVDPVKKSDHEIAEEGLVRMELWMKQMGLVMHLEELGVRRDMLDDLVKATPILTGGYRILTEEDVRNLFMLSM